MNHFNGSGTENLSDETVGAKGTLESRLYAARSRLLRHQWHSGPFLHELGSTYLRLVEHSMSRQVNTCFTISKLFLDFHLSFGSFNNVF